MKTLIAASLLIAGTATAQNLYNNRPDFSLDIGKRNENTGNFSAFGFKPGAASSAVDVRVGPGGWTIDSISVWNFLNDGAFLNVTEAHLFIVAKTGNVPVGNPFTASKVAVTVTAPLGMTQGTQVKTTASGLNINLAAGEYWIALTPDNTAGAFLGNGGILGKEVRGLLDPTFGINFPGGFAWIPNQFNTNKDLAMTITGVPAPAAAALAGFGGLVATRRRR